jgi:hypothetical protein
MEHLMTDIHQADLDRFAETGHMSKMLLHDLMSMDRHFHTDPQKVYTFENLVINARKHGIEVRAIDCASSYYVKSMPISSPTLRQEMLSYFASRTLRKHQDVMGAHKWIALVGNSHSNTYQNIVPGLAELEQGIGVRVRDVPSGQARGPIPDPGQALATGFGNESVFVKGDFLLETALAERPPLPVPVGDKLWSPGMFLIDESEPTQPIIRHRSRDKTLQATPILRNTEGRLYIDQQRWESVHLQPFDALEELKQALIALNLKYVK